MSKIGIGLLVGAMALAGCTKKNSNEILIGHFASMTGNEATFGKSTDNGIQLAVDEVNAAGGVKGKKIRIITMDNQGKAEESRAVVTRLIEQDKVVALLGEVASGRSKAAAPVAQAKKVPMISPSSTNPQVTEIGDYIFRVCFIDPFQGTVMARFATETLNAKKVAILRDVESDYSVGLADFFAQKIKELGGTVIADMSYRSKDVDFKAQLTQLKSKNPEAIFIPGYYTEVGLIARQARELGIKAPLLGGDGWDSPELHNIGQKAIDGGYFSNHYSNETKEPVALQFIENYKKKYGETPSGLAAQGYDALKVLAKAMEASDMSAQSIRDHIAQTKDFAGVTGKITIDEKRNASKPAVVVKVSGPDYKYVTTIAPN